ncbi:MAG: MotA/TolQ/ExbB proton channel family protein [Treponema sp.]|jgi:biopolymer transport protein ExbB|nr:MotA/TolQ/ExbB proton channel family protein [Treponema sp.]
MDTGTVSFSLLELFKMGGIFMWPLLFFSIATIAISLERFIFIFYHDLRMEDLKVEVESYIKTGNINGARLYLLGLTKRRLGARILLTLVNRADTSGGRRLSEQMLEKTVESEALSCINSLENGFNFLTALGSLSPLTGFLGTVSGMIGAFKSIAEATEVNAQIVANGIYEALITTVFGLIIAIIAMISHSLYSHVVDKFAADVEKTCSDLITEIAVNTDPVQNSKGSFAGDAVSAGKGEAL